VTSRISLVSMTERTGGDQIAEDLAISFSSSIRRRRCWDLPSHRTAGSADNFAIRSYSKGTEKTLLPCLIFYEVTGFLSLSHGGCRSVICSKSMIAFLLSWPVSLSTFLRCAERPAYRIGDMINAIYTFGIAHPPGYPMYILLGKIFTTGVHG